MNKKILSLILILFISVVGIGYGLIKYLEVKKESSNQAIIGEYTPQEEITEIQERQTIVTLYFANEEETELKKEGRLIDIKELYLDPYSVLVNMLIEGPNSQGLKKLIPDETKLIGTGIEKNTLIIDFSSKVLEIGNNKEIMISSIVETMQQLIEIEEIQILVEGKTNDEFKGNYSNKVDLLEKTE